MDIDLPNPRHSPVIADAPHDIVPKIPGVQSVANPRDPTEVAPAGPSTLTTSVPQPALPLTISSGSYPLERTPEDEVSVGKEAMIQAELVNSRMK
jgi:hypothetical protein